MLEGRVPRSQSLIRSVACLENKTQMMTGILMEPLLFANIGWMTHYRGPLDSDPATGGHGWLKEHASGHEAWNFKPYRGMVYGCIPGKARSINIDKLGAGPKDTSVDGVTMVFIARDSRNKQTRIVGWYRNATVYRNRGDVTISRAPGTTVECQVVAKEADAVLLEPLQRAFIIPTKKEPGSLGQSLLWYGGTDEFRRKVLDYIDGGGTLVSAPKAKRTGNTPRQLDPEQRKKIEIAAITHARSFYGSKAGGGWTVASVERESVGWDLTVTRQGKGQPVETLKVEVKGLTGRDVCVELTPNEFAKMQSAEHRADYVVYIVTEALTHAARSHVFYYDSQLSVASKSHVWVSEGRLLRIEPRTAARLSV